MSLSPSFAHAVWIRKAVGCAGITCLVYDYFLTLGEEIEYVWKAPWTTTKVVFLVNRYGNLLGQSFTYVMGIKSIANSSFCQTFNLVYTIFILVSSESIHILVLLRAWAIWGCQRRMAIIFISLYLIYLPLTLGMTVAFGPSTKDFQSYQYLEDFGVCTGTMPPYVWITVAASFLLDTVVFGLTMLSLRQHMRECRYLYPSSLVYRLVRDAVMFYIVSVFYDWFTVIFWTVYASDPRYILTMTFALPILSIAGQRLVLNLRGMTVRSYSPRSLSVEIDRQIQAFQDARPSWWQGTSRNESRAVVDIGPSETDLREGLETVGMVAVEDDAETERGERAAGVQERREGNREEFELDEVDDRRGGSFGLERVTEVLRTPEEAHTRQPESGPLWV